MDEPKGEAGDKPDKPAAADQPPPPVEPAELQFDDIVEHVDATEEEPPEHIPVKAISSFRRMSVADGEPFEIDKTALEAILDISSRLAGIQMRSRLSLSGMGQGPETYKDKQVSK